MTIDATQSLKASTKTPFLMQIPALAWFGIACSALVFLNFRGIESLLEAWDKPEYSHGWFIPAIAAFLFLRVMRNEPSDDLTPKKTLPGVIVFSLGLVMSFLGNLSQVPDIVTYGLLVSIAGLILIFAGFPNGLRFWPAWFYLLFLLPLPMFLYWPVSIKAQFISSQLGVMGIKLMGIPVLLEGNVIDLGIYKLQVAEACNGLRYLFPLTSFGFLFAALYRGPAWHKVIIFLSALPITIFMNSFRIAVIGALVDRYGIGQAEGFLHFFEGWVIFLACMVLLFALAWLLQRFAAKPQPVLAVLDLDTQGLLAEARKIGSLKPSGALAAAAVLAVAAGFLWLAASLRPEPIIQRQPLEFFPMTISNWEGKSERLDMNVERVLGASDYLVANYVPKDSGRAGINLLISYYISQHGEGGGIHSPEVCIPGAGWEVQKWGPEVVPVAGVPSGKMSLNRAIVQKGNVRQLVYYWFQQQDRTFTSDYAAKAYSVLQTIRTGRSDAALIRVITMIEGRDVAAADAKLQSFLAQVTPILPEFVPP